MEKMKEMTCTFSEIDDHVARRSGSKMSTWRGKVRGIWPKACGFPTFVKMICHGWPLRPQGYQQGLAGAVIGLYRYTQLCVLLCRYTRKSVYSAISVVLESSHSCPKCVVNKAFSVSFLIQFCLILLTRVPSVNCLQFKHAATTGILLMSLSHYNNK